MTAGASNRDLLARWREGDQWAAQALVDRYLVRLTALARSRLSRKLARRLDAEDIVFSAWRSFFVATERGRITVPDDDNLWPILVTLTLRKLSRQSARHQSERRDVNRDQTITRQSVWPDAVADDPGPEEAAALLDELECLLVQLSPQDREIVTQRLRGCMPQEIAAEVGCSARTVRRAMQRFRSQAEARQTYSSEIENDCSSSPAQAPLTVADARHHKWTSTMPLESMQPTTSLDDIQLQELVGQGGFGKVYRALDQRADRVVAVKFLRKSFWTDQRAIDSFLREIEIVSRLSHSSIIRHHGWGQTTAGAIFIVMDWIDGASLSEVIRRGVIRWEDAVRYGIAVAAAIDTAHSAGVIHADLAPSNVLLGNDGRIVLTDFGFARSKTRSGDVPLGGTTGYLAPEQVSDVFGEVDQRTDVYGLGGLLYAMCTGQPPIGGADIPETLANVLSSRPPLAPTLIRSEIPPKLERAILECLQKEPADRPTSILEVKSQIIEIAPAASPGSTG